MTEYKPSTLDLLAAAAIGGVIGSVLVMALWAAAVSVR